MLKRRILRQKLLEGFHDLTLQGADQILRFPLLTARDLYRFFPECAKLVGTVLGGLL